MAAPAGALDAIVPSVPPRYGSLIQSANTPVNGQDLFNGQRWLEGFAWTPNQCGTVGGTFWVCPPGGGDAPAAKNIVAGDLPAHLTYLPFLIWTGDLCSPVG